MAPVTPSHEARPPQEPRHRSEEAPRRASSPGLQRDAFRLGEGDRYFERNRRAGAASAGSAESDAVLAVVRDARLAARRVLEVGASDGWRLARLLADDPRRSVHGLEPSRRAVRDGSRRHAGVRLVRGTAEALPYRGRSFDLVVLGFCLYLCDRDDLFRIAAEVDRVVVPRGAIVVHDFRPPVPERRPYAHRPGVDAYKLDYKTMFLWNPAYRLVREVDAPHPGAAADDLASRVSTALLLREPETAYRATAGPTPPGEVRP